MVRCDKKHTCLDREIHQLEQLEEWTKQREKNREKSSKESVEKRISEERIRE